MVMVAALMPNTALPKVLTSMMVCLGFMGKNSILFDSITPETYAGLNFIIIYGLFILNLRVCIIFFTFISLEHNH
jgi:hypothetical protein